MYGGESGLEGVWAGLSGLQANPCCCVVVVRLVLGCFRWGGAGLYIYVEVVGGKGGQPGRVGVGRRNCCIWMEHINARA
jgi:hypothetical protein